MKNQIADRLSTKKFLLGAATLRARNIEWLAIAVQPSAGAA